MLLFTNDPVRGLIGGFRDAHAPFQPGEVYVARYMRNPTHVTVTGRGADVVSSWMGDMTVEQFNARVLLSLGRRPRFLGLWMPWVNVDMRRVISCELSSNIGTDEGFWEVPVLCDA